MRDTVSNDNFFFFLLPLIVLGVFMKRYVFQFLTFSWLCDWFQHVFLNVKTIAVNRKWQLWGEDSTGPGWHVLPGQLELPRHRFQVDLPMIGCLEWWWITAVYEAEFASLPSEKNKNQNFSVKLFSSTNFVVMAKKSLRFKVRKLINLQYSWFLKFPAWQRSQLELV